MLEVFRIIDNARRNAPYTGTGGRFDQVFKNPSERVERAIEPAEILPRAQGSEQTITLRLQAVFDKQVSRSPLLSQHNVAG